MPKAIKQFITCEETFMRGYHMSRCTKRGTVQRGEHHFCGTHDPVKVAARDAARKAKWDAEDKIWQDKYRRDNAMRDLCVGVETEKLKQLGSGWVKLVLDSVEKAGYFGY